MQMHTHNTETATETTKLAAPSNQFQSCQPAALESKAFLDESELLARLPVCRRTVHNWIKAGKMPVVKIGRRNLFHWPTVEVALLRHQRGFTGLDAAPASAQFSVQNV